MGRYETECIICGRRMGQGINGMCPGCSAEYRKCWGDRVLQKLGMSRQSVVIECRRFIINDCRPKTLKAPSGKMLLKKDVAKREQ